MLALARENQRRAGASNVEFLKGEIERIPLPDNSVDVIISNCVINLSADKDRVLREAFRVLKPGGRFAVSDVVVRGAVPDEVRKSMLLWVGCIAGALEETDYLAKLEKAGFGGVSIEPTRVYSIEDARQFLTEAGIQAEGGLLRAGLLRACHHRNQGVSDARTLQRLVFMHRQFSTVDHGRGDSEPTRQGAIHRVQRGQSSFGPAAPGSSQADRIRQNADNRAAQQVVG
jgi:hypothetical protein